MSNTEINLTPTATLIDIDSSFMANTPKPPEDKSKDIEEPSKIPCRTWGIASESDAGIVLVHGLGAHAGWFEALARRLKVRQIFEQD